MSFTTFQPAPDLADKVIADVSDPAISLRQVAALHNTTLEALCLWIGSEAVQSRLIAQAKTAAFITRFHAANHADAALAGIVTALRESTTLLAAAPPAIPQRTDSASPSFPNCQLGILEFRRRLVESLRKNSNLIFRLTRFEFFEPGARPRAESRPRAAQRPRAPHAQTGAPDIDQLIQSFAQSAPPPNTSPRSNAGPEAPLPQAAPDDRQSTPTPESPASPSSRPSLLIPTALRPPEPVVARVQASPVEFSGVTLPSAAAEPILRTHRPSQPRAPASLISAAGRT